MQRKLLISSRMNGFEPVGREFESLRAGQINVIFWKLVEGSGPSIIMMIGLRNFAILAALTPFSLMAADFLPTIEAKSLNGQAVAIPRGAGIQAYVLAFGFTHSSQKSIEAWDKVLAPKFSGGPGIVYFEMPVLESMPSLVRPMALHSMRGGLSDAEQSRFVPIYKNEKQLKKLVGYNSQDADAAYLVVASGEGQIVWEGHGAESAKLLEALTAAIAQLVK